MNNWKGIVLGALLVLAGFGAYALVDNDDPMDEFSDQIEEAGEEIRDEIDDAR